MSVSTADSLIGLAPTCPQNWNFWKRLLITTTVALSTTSLYMGAAIVTLVQDKCQLDTTSVKAGLNITLFVWGYGIGSLWFTPMSEIPLFRGRSYIYYFYQLIFCVLQIPTAFSHHLGGLTVLRFLAGIFASPMLSTAGATLGDIWQMPYRVIAMIIWAFGAIAGPFVGPLIGAALTLYHPVSYIFWFMLAVSGGMLILQLLFLSETSEQELLMRKAIKLRVTTGEQDWISAGEILLKSQSFGAVLYEMFFKPIKMTFMEPPLLLMDVHIGLVYMMMYLYLDAMPIVYLNVYGFNTVEMGLAFLAFLVGASVAATGYVAYTLLSAPRMGHPEKVFGPSAVVGSFALPIGVLLWGWLSRAADASGHGRIHWAVGLIGNFFFAIAAILVFQSYFAMMSIFYPPSTAGSAFASNNIVRSILGGAMPLCGSIMYNNTAIDRYPVGWGTTIIALIGILLIPFPIYLTLKGESLREKTQKKYRRE